MKRIINLLFLVLFLISLCITNSFAATKITFMNSKGEIQAQLEDAAKLFEKENPGISIELIFAPVGQSPWEKVMSLYAAGNAPTLIMADPTDLPKIQDKLADLSNEKWVKDIANLSTMALVKSGKKLFAFPMTVEGYGLIYNKTLLDKANVDPASIKTIKNLENAFKKVESAGIGVVTVGPMDWSLGAHFLVIGYATHTKNFSAFDKFQSDLKAGKADLAKINTMNGLISTFDLLKKYNINAKDSMAPSYDIVNEQFGSGKAAFYFMGNWVWPVLEKISKNTAFGYVPIPISNNAKDYGNAGIPVGITKFIGIDTAQNSKEQQEAARKFLNWLVYSSTGQDVIVNKASILPAFKNISLEIKDPLSKSIKEYMMKDNALLFPFCPSDHWPKVGPIMQKYLAGKITKNELFKGIQEYWKSIK